eukprot:Gb_41753 [translate_table: standard]
MGQTLRNHQKKETVMFLSPMLQFRGRKGSYKVTLHTPGNVKSNSLEDVRTLCKQGRLKEALHLLQVMNRCVDSSTYVCLLQGCVKKKALREGKSVHLHMSESGFMPDRIVRNTLVDMYAKCGSLVNARKVFDEMPQRDVCSWTVMIAAYSRDGFAEEALALFRQMQRTGVQPNEFTFASVLPAYANLAALEEGMEIHEEIINSGFQSNVFVKNSLVDMYAKCGNIERARDIFDKMHQRSVVSWNAMIAGYSQNGCVDEALNLFQKMPERDEFSWNIMITGYAQIGHVDEAYELFQKMPQPNVVSWNAMIAGYVQNKRGEEAIKLFRQMQLAGVNPDPKTFVSVLPACASLAAVEQGMKIHEHIIRSGFQSDIFVQSALVDMYAKCGSIEKARHVFDKMNHRNVVSWNSMIAGYVQNGRVDEALSLFDKMPARDVVSWTAMIAGYAQNGHVDEAFKLFQKIPKPNVVSWNAMIAGYAQNGQGEDALNLFRQMKLSGVNPDPKTVASVLPACANLAALEQGMEIHEDIVRSGFQSDVFVESALVDMYAKCGRIEKARYLFDKMHQFNAVSWTAMIAGYVQNGHSDEALKLFRQMQETGAKPESNTFASILPACASLAALEQGMEIHKDIIRCGFQSDVFVGTALVDMYAKCGSIEKARDVFDKMHQRDLVSWNTMIAGYGMHGQGKEALKLFEEMQQSGMNPDHVTLVCVLSACCHAGLVDEGQQYFNCMKKHYHITPAMDHYVCMVDLLGRAGHLDEAQDLINTMPLKPDATMWRCLLGACRVHHNIEVGECVAKRLFDLDPKNAAPYVLLSNIYAAAGRWNDTENVRRMMKDRRIRKTPGCSWIEVNKQVHAFLV